MIPPDLVPCAFQRTGESPGGIHIFARIAEEDSPHDHSMNGRTLLLTHPVSKEQERSSEQPLKLLSGLGRNPTLHVGQKIVWIGSRASIRTNMASDAMATRRFFVMIATTAPTNRQLSAVTSNQVM